MSMLAYTYNVHTMFFSSNHVNGVVFLIEWQVLFTFHPQGKEPGVRNIRQHWALKGLLVLLFWLEKKNFSYLFFMK